MTVNSRQGEKSENNFIVKSSGEDEALFLDSSANTLYINKGETAFTTVISNDNDEAIRVDATGVVFNEDGHATNDFRVESDSESHALFINAGSNQLDINLNGTAFTTVIHNVNDQYN